MAERLKNGENPLKTEFAKEKSEYAHILGKLISQNLSDIVRIGYMIRLKQLESTVKKSGDKLIFVVTTTKTNPFGDKCAAPMSMENIKKS